MRTTKQDDTEKIVLAPSETPSTRRPLTKVELLLCSRIYKAMLAKGWNQSTLARESGLTRDSISKYVRGHVVPSPDSLVRLNRALDGALGSQPESFIHDAALQGTTSNAAEEEVNLQMLPARPGFCMLTIRKVVPMAAAVKVLELVQSEAPSN